jgi:hypothetical protein
VDIEVDPQIASFSYALNRDKLRKVRRREGRYLLRTNLCKHQPEKLWKFYVQLTETEAAFKTLEVIWKCARSSIKRSSGSKLTSSSPSWPTVSTSRCVQG